MREYYEHDVQASECEGCCCVFDIIIRLVIIHSIIVRCVCSMCPMCSMFAGGRIAYYGLACTRGSWPRLLIGADGTLHTLRRQLFSGTRERERERERERDRQSVITLIMGRCSTLLCSAGGGKYGWNGWNKWNNGVHAAHGKVYQNSIIILK